MKLLSWNCQGLGNPLTVRSLKALVAKERPDILFLMETKNQEVVVQRVRKRLNYPNSVVQNPVGIAGGIALFWNDQFTIMLDRSVQEFIDVICTDLMSGSQMRLIYIHAPANLQQRHIFWVDLRFICAINTLPWICIGDFNEVLYPWTNQRLGDELIRERLDRALCNLEWRLNFPEAEVFALPALGSDHSPLLLNTVPSQCRRHRPFIFESFWLQDPDCRDIVARSWNSGQQHNTTLPSRLKVVTSALARWSRSKFSGGHRQLAILHQQLQDHTNQPLSTYDASLVTHLS